MSPQLVSVSWYVDSVSPYCSASATNVFDMNSLMFLRTLVSSNLISFVSSPHFNTLIISKSSLADVFSVRELSAVSVLSF